MFTCETVGDQFWYVKSKLKSSQVNNCNMGSFPLGGFNTCIPKDWDALLNNQPYHCGKAPLTTNSENRFGDKGCLHLNLGGTAFLTSDPRLYCQPRSWRQLVADPSSSLHGISICPCQVYPNTQTGNDAPEFGDHFCQIIPCTQSCKWDFGATPSTRSTYEILSRVLTVTVGDHTLTLEHDQKVRDSNATTSSHLVSTYTFSDVKTDTLGRDTVDIYTVSTADFTDRYGRVEHRSGSGFQTSVVSSVTGFAGKNPTFDYDHLLRIAQLDLNQCDQTHIPDWGDVAEDACNNMRVSTTDWIENLAGFGDFKDLFTSSLSKKVANNALQGIAGSFLAEQYVLEATMSDINDALNAAYHKTDFYVDVFRVSKSRRTGYSLSKQFEGNWTIQRSAKLYFSPPYDFMSFFAFEAWVYGFSATTSTLWDLIPFSFVVDWAINVGDCFTRLDDGYFLSYVKQESCLVTERSTIIVPAWDLSPHLCGSLTVTIYHRQVRSSLPPMPLRLDTAADPASHFWQGSALAIQLKRTH